MNGVIYIETLKQSWRSILYWGSGLAFLAIAIMIVIPDVDALQRYAELLEIMPPALLQMFGASDANALTTPEGFINFGFFGYSIMVLAFFAVLLGLQITADEEDEGILDVVLSMPLLRSHLIVEKFLAYSTILMATVVCSAIGLVIGSQTSTLEVDLTILMKGFINLIVGSILIIAITALVATLVRRRSLAITITATILLTSYLINVIGGMATDSIADTLRNISFFHYYETGNILVGGLSAVNLSILLVITGIVVFTTIRMFEHRDIGL